MKIFVIKTDKCCFITDLDYNVKTSTYDREYHNSVIPNLDFDGEQAKTTWARSWYSVSKFPQNIKKWVKNKTTNERYELMESSLESELLPKVISIEKCKELSESVSGLYSYKSDLIPPFLEELSVEIETVLEIENYNQPRPFEFSVLRRLDWSDKKIIYTEKDIKHNMLDRILLPEVLLSNTACSLSSTQMYNITRQYVKEHIDNKFAKITSDYDFCFTVKKLYPLYAPEEVAYQNVFARTKRERLKIHHFTKSCLEKQIFQMTHAESNYQGYTPIKGLFANSQDELNDKINEWLTELIARINKPVSVCQHCKGVGYFED